MVLIDKGSPEAVAFPPTHRHTEVGHGSMNHLARPRLLSGDQQRGADRANNELKRAKLEEYCQLNKLR